MHIREISDHKLLYFFQPVHYINLNIAIGTEDCAVEEVDVGGGEKVFKVRI